MPSSKEEVLGRLRKQRIDEETVDTVAVISEWKESVRCLLERIREWLADAVSEGLFTVEPETISREEERLGLYEADALKIVTPKGDVIRIAPRGRYAVGAYGRVDFESPSDKAILVRADREPDRWKFASLEGPHGWVLKDLDEEEFWNALSRLIA
jgi:hypothetical protein